jgi:hypothetical protein
MASIRTRKRGPTPLTPQEFFGRKLTGFSQAAARRATGLAGTTISDCALGKHAHGARPETLRALETWSRLAIAPHGCFISAAKALGLDAPVEDVRLPHAVGA